MGDQTNAKLPTVFDDLDVGIILHNPETGAILDINERIEHLFGYSADELRTMAVEDFTAPSTQFSKEEAVRRIQAAADGDTQVLEWRIERPNGELRWIQVHLNSTTIDGMACVCAEIEDITVYKARERRLRLLSRILRHNLRNRMTVLTGYIDRVKAAVEDDTLADKIEPILDITREVGTISDSVRQIEEIAEPDATYRSPTNLSDVVYSAVEDARAEYPDIDLTVEAPADVWVIADKGIEYALDHAIENAIEHNDQETPTVTVTVATDPETGQGEVRIADNGPPIPDNEIDVLSEEAEASSTYHGTGVGLWVMQWCVDSLGGELTFTENTPRGNIVTFSLPKADAPPSNSS